MDTIQQSEATIQERLDKLRENGHLRHYHHTWRTRQASRLIEELSGIRKRIGEEAFEEFLQLEVHSNDLPSIEGTSLFEGDLDVLLSAWWLLHEIVTREVQANPDDHPDGMIVDIRTIVHSLPAAA